MCPQAASDISVESQVSPRESKTRIKMERNRPTEAKACEKIQQHVCGGSLGKDGMMADVCVSQQ